jgi:triosephosphate isomerase
MRKPMMAGNWKMNKTVSEAVALAEGIRTAVDGVNNVDRVVCPPFVDLPAVQAALAGSNIAVGAQNMHWAASGAYTGEVSADMLKGLAQYVIIGHSERRQYFAETDESVNKKTKAALAAGLTPIVCVGESLAQNEAGETQAFVSGQVRAALAGLTPEQVARSSSPTSRSGPSAPGARPRAQQANDICGGVVRATVRELYGEATAAATPHPLRRQRQRQEHPRTDGTARHRRRAHRRRRAQGGELRGDGARDGRVVRMSR